METQALPRQLVICCDGTNNNITGWQDDTNVVKLSQLMAELGQRDQQMLFYDPGVGNPGELPGVTPLEGLKRRFERVAGLAMGRGVFENIAECYRFLMQHYQPGDELYFVGFSRGAFTARSVAGLVNQFGILHAHMTSMVPTLIHIYFSDRDLKADQIKAIATQATTLFAPPESRRVEIQFVGVWDTVASVGLGPLGIQITAIPTIVNKQFRHVRQALALDEQRAQFKPRLYSDDNGTYQTASGQAATLKQLWFRGSHCDVGGGYAAGRLATSERALAWLVSEAVQCGLRLTHQGQPLDTEAAVVQAMGLREVQRRQVLHSQSHATCLWALTGLAVRESDEVVLDNGHCHRVKAVEHPSVAADALKFPADTTWAKARPQKALWSCLLALPLLWHVMDQMLSGLHRDDLPWWTQLAMLEQWRHGWGRYWDFGWWQSGGWAFGALSDGLTQFAAPRSALAWELLFIGAWAYVLSWLAVAGFARGAGVRRAGQAVPRWLNRLGWALPLTLFAALFKAVLTWGVLTSLLSGWEAVPHMLAVWMTLAAWLQGVGLVGTLCLIVWPGSRQSA